MKRIDNYYSIWNGKEQRRTLEELVPQEHPLRSFWFFKRGLMFLFAFAFFYRRGCGLCRTVVLARCCGSLPSREFVWRFSASAQRSGAESRSGVGEVSGNLPVTKILLRWELFAEEGFRRAFSCKVSSFFSTQRGWRDNRIVVCTERRIGSIHR